MFCTYNWQNPTARDGHFQTYKRVCDRLTIASKMVGFVAHTKFAFSFCSSRLFKRIYERENGREITTKTDLHQLERACHFVDIINRTKNAQDCARAGRYLCVPSVMYKISVQFLSNTNEKSTCNGRQQQKSAYQLSRLLVKLAKMLGVLTLDDHFHCADIIPMSKRCFALKVFRCLQFQFACNFSLCSRTSDVFRV